MAESATEGPMINGDEQPKTAVDHGNDSQVQQASEASTGQAHDAGKQEGTTTAAPETNGHAVEAPAKELHGLALNSGADNADDAAGQHLASPVAKTPSQVPTTPGKEVYQNGSQPHAAEPQQPAELTLPSPAGNSAIETPLSPVSPKTVTETIIESQAPVTDVPATTEPATPASTPVTTSIPAESVQTPAKPAPAGEPVPKTPAPALATSATVDQTPTAAKVEEVQTPAASQQTPVTDKKKAVEEVQIPTASQQTAAAERAQELEALQGSVGVKELRKQLSSAGTTSTPPPSLSKSNSRGPSMSGAASPRPVYLPKITSPSNGSVSMKVRETSPAVEKKSEHDIRNTINAADLIKQGAFKFQPGQDFIAYAELVKLRLEDGIDPTRKEEYLNDEEFVKVMGMARDAFAKMPAWRRGEMKKKVLLF